MTLSGCVQNKELTLESIAIRNRGYDHVEKIGGCCTHESHKDENVEPVFIDSKPIDCSVCGAGNSHQCTTTQWRRS